MARLRAVVGAGEAGAVVAEVRHATRARGRRTAHWCRSWSRERLLEERQDAAFQEGVVPGIPGPGHFAARLAVGAGVG
ncbi:hypothetical protein [Streptomyces sp. NPDC088350]|uniref:hypothetical protein n=1 Tax=Streptomyces sp. NPDC088350 TaxID=3365854 RepID=UPI0037FEDBB4